jgi:membrane protein DedA with SNARE-associated domain
MRGRVTEEAFFQFCQQFSDQIWLQGLLVAVGTCFLEDAARCGVGLLVAAGQINWWVAFVSMTIGGMAGDIGLYLIGRYATLFLIRRRWVDAARLAWMETYFERQAVKTVLIARFLPGARTLAYVSAGAIKYPMPRLLLLLLIASLAQSALFIQLGVFIGQRILPYLEDPRLRVAVFSAIVLLLVLTHHVLTRRNKNKPLQGR